MTLRDRSSPVLASLLSLALAVLVGPRHVSAQPPTITVDGSRTFQTIVGWEATAQANQLDPNYASYRDEIMAAAVDFGINRIRLEVRSGMENPTDWWKLRFIDGAIDADTYRSHRYEIINDNMDPRVADPAGFQFAQLDHSMETVVLPLRAALAAATGEHLHVNLCYVDFGVSAFEHAANSPEYAELVLTVVEHLHTKYGIVPDTWEVTLEPENTGGVWLDRQIAQGIQAAGDRLAAAGYGEIKFIAPSVLNIVDFWHYPSSYGSPYITELSYHRYGGGLPDQLQQVAATAAQYGKRTSMLEHIGSSYVELHDDLKYGNVSAWQQYALAFPTADNGAQYFTINGTTVTTGSRTKLLRHYFKYVRSGAVRIGATSENSLLDPLAFRNADGGQVVVVKSTATSEQAFSVAELPPGTYGVLRTAGGNATVSLPDQTVGPGDVVSALIGAPGVITIYPKAAAPAVPTETPVLSPSPTQSPPLSVTATQTLTRTPTQILALSPSAMPSATSSPADIGGAGLSIGATSDGVAMSWRGGSRHTGYQVARLAGGVVSVLPTGPPLPAGVTGFTDTTAPGGLDCYALMPLGTSPQAFSDLECVVVGFHSATGSPQNFTLRLNQSTTASLGWARPLFEAPDGYLLLTLGGEAQILGADVAGVNLATNGFTCFVLGALRAGGLTGYTDILCGIPGFSTLGGGATANQAGRGQVRPTSR
jgi:hypothetical protein